jgi:pyrroloquinoline quinone biosynthesis protein B
MYFGREALGAKSVPVYALPRMKTFLETNGPWSQLVTLNNIQLHEIKEREEVELTDKLKVEPVKVPHRDEFSETVGYIIKGPSKKALFMPDIDKWEKWDYELTAMLKEVDYAFLDGTFYDTKELNNRKMSEVPHPCVIETMEKLSTIPSSEKNKIWFIHLNHTNPLLNKSSEQFKSLIERGFHVTDIQMHFLL